VEYADLAVIDLSKASTPEGRKELTVQLSRAMHETGFFYVINHGYTQEQVGRFTQKHLDRSLNFRLQTNRIFGIANLLFDNVSEDEKKIYAGKSTAVYEGYKPKQTWVRFFVSFH